MTLQGEPAARQPLGRLLLIIELIPITTSLPIVTFGKTILHAGNQTLLPIFTGPKSDGKPCVISNQAP